MLGKTHGGTVPGRGSIGSIRSKPIACSNNAAAPKALTSPRVGAAICRPTGRPYWSKPAGAATAAAVEGFRAWKTLRGHDGKNLEHDQVRDKVGGFIERHGDSRFSDADADDEKDRHGVRDRAGQPLVHDVAYYTLNQIPKN